MRVQNKYLFLLFVLCISQTYGQYSVSDIPAELKKDADAVIRISDYKFEIKNQRKALLTVKSAVTIFKKSEEFYGRFYEFYDQFHEIEELEGRIYDGDGKLIRELDSDHIKDYSAVSDYSLYEDSRIKSAELYHNVYPYTVEFVYELSYDGYINFPGWNSRSSIDPVEKSRFEVITSDDNVRYWCNQDTVKPLVVKKDGKVHYFWGADNLPKLSRDAIGEYIEDVATVVKIAPSKFEIEDYSGNMSSWKDFGIWYNQLCINRDKLSGDAVKEINSLLTPDDNIRNKVVILYKYFQARTRYVSIQLGIGSWQPYDAEFVHSRGYGDCKALVNYMKAILATAGITSYPVLINSGKYRYPMISEFPSNQFNHVILCVPSKDDTIWLECTSQSAPPGYLGSGNENRSALMITPGGGVVICIPKTTSLYNLQQRNANVNMRSDGTAIVKSRTQFSGNNRGYVQNILDTYSPEEQHEWILNSVDNPDCKIDLLNFEPSEDKSDITITFNSTMSRYANVSNNRIFFNPNLMERKTTVPNDVAKRISPVIFSYPYLDVDTIIYEIPDGYKIESLPRQVNFNISVAEYNSQVQVISDNKIIYTRSFEIKDYSLKAEEYPDYRKFYADVVKADRAMVVLVKKN